jgi:dienelactone hydrolase
MRFEPPAQPTLCEETRTVARAGASMDIIVAWPDRPGRFGAVLVCMDMWGIRAPRAAR